MADLFIYNGFPNGSLILDGFDGKSAWALEVGQLDRMWKLFLRSDWRALYKLNPEWLPSYCPACRVNYCSDHWDMVVEFDDGFYDCTSGTCPRGHNRILSD